MNEEQVVPAESTSTEEDASKEASTEKGQEETQKQDLTEEKVTQMIAEAAGRAAETAKEAGRRELQGEQDRKRNAEKRARLAETRADSYETSFKDLDEDTRKEVELVQLRGRDQYYQRYMKEEEQGRVADDYYSKLKQALDGELTAFGIDPTDKRIDKALDETDYFKGRERFTASVVKVLQEGTKKERETLKTDLEDWKKKAAVDLGLESQDTSTSPGGDVGEAKFIEEYNEGARNSPADHKRAKAILEKQQN